MVYIAYSTELNLQICDCAQKRRICRENCKYALDENFHGHFCPPRKAAKFCHPGHMYILRATSVTCLYFRNVLFKLCTLSRLGKSLATVPTIASVRILLKQKLRKPTIENFLAWVWLFWMESFSQKFLASATPFVSLKSLTSFSPPLKILILIFWDIYDTNTFTYLC